MIKPVPLDGSPVEYIPYSTADIETGKNGELLDVSLYYEGFNYETFSDWGDWLNHVIKLSKKNKNLREIWAHNGANFDWQHLIEYCIKNRPDIKPQARMSKSIGISVQLTIEKLRYKIHLYDSYRLLPRSLKDLSHDLGVETPKIEIELLPEDLKKINPQKYYEYLKADTIACSQILTKVQQIINENICIKNPVRKLKTTVASQAKDIWRREFLKQSIYVPRNKKFKAFERKTYHGGLVLCPDNGIYNDCMGIDRVSMYPAEMANINLPTFYRSYKTRKYVPEKPGLYYVEYDTKDKKFPFIFDENNKISVSGKAYITSIEYDYIVSIGGFVKVIYGFVFTNFGPILRQYSLKLFELKSKAKKDGHKAIETVAKLFLNSLYGKFAQSDMALSIRFMTYPEIEKARKQGKRVKPQGLMTIVEEEMYSIDSFVSIASFITASARVSLMKVVRANYDKALYTDTDSVFVQGQIQGVKLGSNLGDWSIEWQHCTLTLAGRKTYAVQGENDFIKIRAKGISLPRKRTLDDNLAIIEKLKNCAMDINHTEKFTFSTAPTNHDVFIKGKKSAKWEEKVRTVRATSDKAQYNRGIQIELDKITMAEDKLIISMRKEIQKEFRRVIIANGGISPYKNGYWKEEMSVIPVSMKRLTGVPLDQMVEILKSDYPGYGIHSENDLIEYIQKYY